jgi:regulator of replication initiation timing
LAKAAVSTVELQPIDRLEEKVKALVGIVDRLRTENARASEDNARLAREIDTLRGRLAEAEGTSAELATLRDERDQIRSRVADMLSTIEALDI